ncbi:hypothetical protein BBW65_05040 [Helicobacter enhydrae]|uniref:Serine aminopeptidase S33 domain-containing protein n=1 Tax=Helicobacter enhydrae TaxID=222136 RepID=A0A1B1U677_9HELI|nr:alpha/beta fold hydrolase [Helicobacter enhydrae]ANV98202.1 hypothetical protein BBW65_05040 [Helicobacter enhydrae]
MQKEHLSFQSDFGEIVYSVYCPQTPNNILIQIAHGMIEERSKYEAFATFLCLQGYTIAVSDHRGHGESIGGKSGDYEVGFGEMGENGFERAVQDLLTLTKILKQRFNPKHFVLFGHSMGSLLSRRYLQLYEAELDALILMGTPSPNFFASLGSKICKKLEAFKYDKVGTKLMNLASVVGFNREFKRRDPLNPHYAWLTRDLEGAKAYQQREDYNFSFTLNSFGGLFAGLHQVFSTYPNAKRLDLPILFLSGDDDPCGEFGNGAHKAYKHLVSQGYHCVQLRLYSGARHELLLETNKTQVMREIKEWLDGVFAQN